MIKPLNKKEFVDMLIEEKGVKKENDRVLRNYIGKQCLDSKFHKHTRKKRR